MRKKLIEVALPLEAINEASAREKSIRHGHPSTLHLWWARRPLAACRAVIFASLVDDPDDPQALPEFVAACRKLPARKNALANDTPRQRLFDFIEELVQWESTTNETILQKARELIRIATNGNPPPLLDPFAGGGSIPLEAQRLGLEAHASDLNPVAVMINKALIEIPPKFANRPPVNPRDRVRSNRFSDLKRAKAVTTNLPLDTEWQGAAGLAADVRYYGEWMRERAWERIGHLYPPYLPPASGEDKRGGETVIAWLWARTVKCPNPACGAQMPLVRSFDLSKKKGRKAWIEPQVDPQTRQISYVVHQGEGVGPEGTVNRKGATCIACGTPVAFDYIRAEGKAKRMGAQLMAIVTEGKHGRNYYAPTAEHEQTAQIDMPEDAPNTDLPEHALGFRVQLYGMTQHRDLFTPRQLVALTTFSNLVNEVRQQIGQDARQAGMSDNDTPLREGGTSTEAYAEAVSVYLAFAVDKGANYWSTISSWHSGRDTVTSTFARQALPMVWDYTEANPFSSSSGNFLSGIFQAHFILEELSLSSRFNSAMQSDAANSVKSIEVISTDPPYYDNIGYADLSDFFYVWLRRSLKEVYPDIFSTVLVPKKPELIASPHRFEGSKVVAKEHFESGLMQAFANMRQRISFQFPLSIFYAFKQTEMLALEEQASTGWETMLNGLIDSGFLIIGTWPMHTELTTNLKKDVNALASSIVLVCRPRPENALLCSRREFLNALRQELPNALREMQSGNIAPVDLAQASIGPGMAVYSRYSKVLEPDGERLSVRAALQLINQELDAYLAEQEGELDGDSRFALAWFEQFGFKEGAFGQADVLARAKNTSVEGLVRAGLLQSGAGKVRLLPWTSLPEDWQPAAEARLTIWQAAHQLIKRFHTQGEQGAGALLADLPSEVAAEARQLAYRLYNICERKGWAEQARDYNALVISWNASQEHAQKLKTEPKQEELKLQELIYKQE